MPSLARLQQGGRWALAALALAALTTVYSNVYFPFWLHAIVPIVAAVAIVRPREMLIAIAAIGPFVNMLVTASGSPPLRALEVLVLAFLAGWLLRRPARAGGPAARRLLVPAAVLIALAVTSSAALALELHRASASQFASTMNDLRRWYLWTEDPTGVVAAVALIEGVLLLLAVTELSEDEPRVALALIEALAAGGAVTALLAVLMAAGRLPDVLIRHFGAPGHRYVAHITDVNAAGSYYAMLIGLSCGVAASTAGRRRRIWIAVAALLALGLLLTGSRSALAAIAMIASVVAVFAGARGRRPRFRPRLAWLLAAALAVAVGIVFARTSFLFASELRGEFFVTSLRMLAERPVFGIGIGRYYHMSRLILTPRLGAFYGEENAHNYFLQITVELGVAGGLAFLGLLIAALKPVARSLADRRRDFVSAGLFAGAAAFLITSVAGHPFLVREAAVPFWILLGVAMVASGPLSATSPSRPRRAAALVAIALLFVSVPFRPGVPRLRLKAGEEGFGPWWSDGEGRVHTMGAFASLFVGPQVTAVDITMRRAGGDRHQSPLLVVDQEPGWSQHWTRVGADWVVVRATLPTAAPLMPFQRINLSVLNRDGSPPTDGDGALVDVRDLVITGAAR